MEVPPHVGKNPAFGPRGPIGANTEPTVIGLAERWRWPQVPNNSEAVPQSDEGGNQRANVPYISSV